MNYIQDGEELFVVKGKEDTVNGSQWQNTGQYWAVPLNAKGNPRPPTPSNYKTRTSSSRGTHRVFKSRAKEIKKAQLAAAKVAIKQQMNLLSSQLSSLAVGPSIPSKTGALPINEAFIRQVVAAGTPNNIVYGQKFSRGVLNMNIQSLKEYAMIRDQEGIPPAQIAAELDHLYKEKELNGALAVLKQRKQELNEVERMLAGLGMGGGKKRRHTKKHKKSHKRRHTKRNH
jgi:hypothetical protein